MQGASYLKKLASASFIGATLLSGCNSDNYTPTDTSTQKSTQNDTVQGLFNYDEINTYIRSGMEKQYTSTRLLRDSASIAGDLSHLATTAIADFMDPSQLVLLPLDIIGDIFGSIEQQEELAALETALNGINDKLAAQQQEIVALAYEMQQQNQTYNNYIMQEDTNKVCNAVYTWTQTVSALAPDSNITNPIVDTYNQNQCNNEYITTESILQHMNSLLSPLADSNDIDPLYAVATDSTTMLLLQGFFHNPSAYTNSSSINPLIESLSSSTVDESALGGSNSNIQSAVIPISLNNNTECFSNAISDGNALSNLIICQKNELTDFMLPVPGENNDSNFTDAVASYNDMVMTFYQQSAAGLQGIYVAESFANILNYFNYTAVCIENKETKPIQIPFIEEYDTLKQYVHFNYSECNASSEKDAYTSLMEAQANLATLFAARFNSLYVTTMSLLISDAPENNQTYTSPPSGSNRTAQADLYQTIQIQDLNGTDTNSNGKVPVENLDGVFYQYQNINNIYGCMDKALFSYTEYNASASSVNANTCTPAFPDTHSAYYDGQSISYYIPTSDGFNLSNRLDLNYCGLSQKDGYDEGLYVFNHDTLWCKTPGGKYFTDLLTTNSYFPPQLGNFVCYGITLNGDGSTDLFPNTSDCTYNFYWYGYFNPLDPTSIEQTYSYLTDSSLDYSSYKVINEADPYYGQYMNRSSAYSSQDGFDTVLYASNVNTGVLAYDYLTPSTIDTSYTVGRFNLSNSNTQQVTIVSQPFQSNDNDFEHTALIHFTLPNGYTVPLYLLSYEVAKTKDNHNPQGYAIGALCPTVIGRPIPGLQACSAANNIEFKIDTTDGQSWDLELSSYGDEILMVLFKITYTTSPEYTYNSEYTAPYFTPIPYETFEPFISAD